MEDPHIAQAIDACAGHIKRAIDALRKELGEGFEGTVVAELTVTPLKEKPTCRTIE